MKTLYIFLLLISENSRCCCWDTHWPVFLNLITTRFTNLADKSENQSSHFTIQISKVAIRGALLKQQAVTQQFVP